MTKTREYNRFIHWLHTNAIRIREIELSFSYDKKKSFSFSAHTLKKDDLPPFSG